MTFPMSGWYMSSTSNVAPVYRDAIGHIEGLTGVRPVALNATRWWCLDNSVFTGRFEEKKWLKHIERLQEWKEKCLFVTIPDVVGDSETTLSQFSHYRNMVKDLPVALVSQDGIRSRESRIPWDDFDCLFVGGSDEHKLGSEGRWIIEEAKKRGKWVHGGRVNSPKRIRILKDADSWDGTKLSFEPSYVKVLYVAVLENRKEKEERKAFHEFERLIFNSRSSLLSVDSGVVYSS